MRSVAFEVRALPEAEDDLFGKYRHVAEHGGAERADEFDQRIRVVCEKLADFPNRGRRATPWSMVDGSFLSSGGQRSTTG